MPDPRFYRRAGPFRLADLAGRCGARLASGSNPDLAIQDIADIETAGAGDIVYFADPSYVIALGASRCGACVTNEKFAAKVAGPAVVIAADAREVFAQMAAAFYPHAPMPAQDHAVSADAVLGKGVALGPGVVIGAKASIGERSTIGANAVIGPGVVIGNDCRIAPNTTIAYALLGNGIIIHPGVQIGQDGFGFAPTGHGLIKVPQLGRVVIHDDVEIGANTTIDRGALGDTVVGAGTKIDNLVQIAHNVQIGTRCVIVSLAGLAGSCVIGDGAIIGGQVGVAPHVHVGEGAQIGAQSGVMRDIGPGEVVLGSPSRPVKRFWREVAALQRLTQRDKNP